ncbi:hypothetical protein FV222_03070 [Methylobacterium sp. WL103]|uniref:hypothetical protein n=1 Tax=Methylobacterium sp. WL103 TaxID=2603891 RepID=UPI0011C94147|nr:hypothetical protein [Methylobacterium sp. WL103]TXN07159.1 hypothetical protein FV222_03070 [Methylobacterium sp. WL103]
MTERNTLGAMVIEATSDGAIALRISRPLGQDAVLPLTREAAIGIAQRILEIATTLSGEAAQNLPTFAVNRWIAGRHPLTRDALVQLTLGGNVSFQFMFPLQTAAELGHKLLELGSSTARSSASKLN